MKLNTNTREMSVLREKLSTGLLTGKEKLSSQLLTGKEKLSSRLLTGKERMRASHEKLKLKVRARLMDWQSSEVAIHVYIVHVSTGWLAGQQDWLNHGWKLIETNLWRWKWWGASWGRRVQGGRDGAPGVSSLPPSSTRAGQNRFSFNIRLSPSLSFSGSSTPSFVCLSDLPSLFSSLSQFCSDSHRSSRWVDQPTKVA